MSDFDSYKFVADNAGMNIFQALEKAYQKGKADAMKWIPCSERLPEYHTDILMTLRNGAVTGGFLSVGEEYFYAESESGKYVEKNNVLAWMPLPEPYEAENDRDKTIGDLYETEERKSDWKESVLKSFMRTE